MGVWEDEFITCRFRSFMDRLECIFYDFDGVMTDNRVMVDENGIESVFVSRADGYGVARIKEMGIPQVIVSTEKNQVVEKRAEKLGLEVIHGVANKRIVVKEYCRKRGYHLEDVIFMGNDLNDLPAMAIVGFKAAPADAEPEILAIADWVSEKNGGYGAIRDLYRLLAETFGEAT